MKNEQRGLLEQMQQLYKEDYVSLYALLMIGSAEIMLMSPSRETCYHHHRWQHH
jgi:hypothetical protein